MAFVKSSTPGKAWWIVVHGKERGRPGYASATEVTPSADGHGFSFELFGDTRRLRVGIDGPATERKKNAAVAELMNQLRRMGAIAEEAQA